MLTYDETTKQSALDQLFENALKELYWCERNLANVLTTMTDAATNEELKDSFRQHQTETLVHANRLEKVFELMEINPETKHSKGLQGLFDEGWQVIDETEDGTSQRDVALIMAAQKVEHFEISCYGSLITLAKTLQKNEIADILIPTLEEEKTTDQKLTEIAESGINEEAAEEELPVISNMDSDISEKNEQLETESSASIEQTRAFSKDAPF